MANPDMATSFPKLRGAFEGRALFVAGETSSFLKREHEAEIRRTFPDAEFSWIPNGGHWLHAERHKDFMETVAAFLQRPST